MPPPWISTERVTSWGLEKNLDENKYDTKTQNEHSALVHPMGDYRFNERARSRQLDNLMGVAPKPERREILIQEQRLTERPKTRAEEWESQRNRASLMGNEVAYIAMKRDGAAWTDEDGYSTVKEPPAFRDGFNNILRVKPPQEEHLHNGLASLPLRANASATTGPALMPKNVTTTNHPERPHLKSNTRVFTTSHNIAARASDMVHRLTLRPEITAALGQYFMKGITTGLSGISVRELKGLASLFRKEYQTNALNGVGAEGIASKSEESPELDGARLKGEIELFLRALETLEAPVGYKDQAEAEEAKRKMVEMSRALGNAFVSLGMTLPAGSRDDPMRNDSVALEMGSRIMMSGVGGKHAPIIEESIRKEVATALGRAILHLQTSAGLQASRGSSISRDSAQRDRTFKLAIGKLTLQLIEATAARSSSSAHETERNKVDASLLKRSAFPVGPMATSKEKINVRMNKPHEVIVQRPILGSRDSAPTTVPRYKPTYA